MDEDKDEASQKSDASHSRALSDSQRYQLEMKKHRQAEIAERKRILRLLQTDREEIKAQRLKHPHTNTIQPLKKQTRSLSLTQSNQCALVIRLFDGKALKNIFNNTDSLDTVRNWVDENRSDSDDPYQFFQTFPKRSFGPGEESLSLLELDLCPSSTLILVPVQNVLNAYSSSYSPSAWLNVTSRSLAGALYTFLGIGYRPPPPPTPAPATSDEQTQPPASIPDTSHLLPRTPHTSTPHASGTSTPLNASPPKIETPIPSHAHTPSFALSQNDSKPNSIASSRSSSALNIRTLHDNNDDQSNDDRLTYNGNQLNLEDDSKK